MANAGYSRDSLLFDKYIVENKMQNPVYTYEYGILNNSDSTSLNSMVCIIKDRISDALFIYAIRNPNWYFDVDSMESYIANKYLPSLDELKDNFINNKFTFYKSLISRQKDIVQYYNHTDRILDFNQLVDDLTVLLEK